MALLKRDMAEELPCEAAEAIADKDVLLSAVFDSAMDGMFIIDMSGRYMDVNPAGCRMFGYQRDEFLSSDIALLLFPEDVERAFKRGETSWRKGKFIQEYRMRRKDGSELWVEMTVNPIRVGGKDYALGVKRDITERRRAKRMLETSMKEIEDKVRERTSDLKRLNDALAVEVKERLKAEEVLRAIVEGTSAVAGTEFFRSLAERLASTLGFKNAVVGEVTDESCEKVRTLSWWSYDRFVPNVEYELKGTPCENVVGREACVYPRGVQELFPDDKYLVDLGIESYIGVPLFDSRKAPLGIIAAMDDKPLNDGAREKAIVEIFASRAAFELERTRLEDEKRKTTETLRAIVDNSSSAIFLKDADGRIVFVNRWHEVFFNKKNEELVGKFDSDIFPKEFVEKIRADDKAVVEAGRPLEFEDRLIHPDGTEHAYLVTKFPIAGMPGAVCGISTDITERKVAEEELKKSEESLREAQRLAGIGSWDLDLETGQAVHSEEFYRIIGRTPEEFDGCTEEFLKIVHQDDGDILRKSIEEAIAGKDESSIEYRIILPDGTVRNVQDHVKTMYDKDGRPVRMLGTIQDVTERKRTEEELLKAQKLETVASMAGRFAHDFNNILMGVIGNASVAKEFVKPGDKVFSLLEGIDEAATRAKGLTRQFLTFSKGGEPVKEAVSPATLLKGNVCLVLDGLSVECECDFPEDIWDVEVDEGQIAQVFNNVVLNAAQSMPGGGTVRIKAENVEVDEKSGLPLDPGRYVKVDVKDHGSGIPKINLKKIFEPFFTTKEKASGLGLAMSYSVVKKHKGHIAVKSLGGRGTTVSIYLPSPKKESYMHVNHDETPIASNGKILVMDDEELIRYVVGEMLGVMGFEVDFAVEGAEAVEKYRLSFESGAPYTAVIMDLTVPGGVGGVEAIKDLLKIDPEVRAIVSSGFSKDPVMSDFRSYGFSGVITKPYRVADFRKVIKSVLAGKKH